MSNTISPAALVTSNDEVPPAAPNGTGPEVGVVWLTFWKTCAQRNAVGRVNAPALGVAVMVATVADALVPSGSTQMESIAL